MVSHPSRRALAFGAAVSLGIACIAPSQAAFAVEKAPAIPLVRPAVLSAAVTLPGAAAEEAVADLEQVRALAAAIGNQSTGGHTICCPAYACAYGDAILTGQANDHGAYGCGCCTWPGWGGGNSSFRSLGSDEALLREAYDEIAAGRPTVVHVAGPYGEHWICLMGYQGVEDPDALSLDNFIALDPANGLEVTASYRYAPYGDACEHVSDLR